MIRAVLLAVWLQVDYAVDVKRRENRRRVLVSKYDHSVAPWRDLGMVDGGY